VNNIVTVPVGIAWPELIPRFLLAKTGRNKKLRGAILDPGRPRGLYLTPNVLDLRVGKGRRRPPL
jgi:hypothetical protein